MDKQKWQKIDRTEQESILLLDYEQKEIDFYTSREAVYRRVIKAIGTPVKIYYTKQLITGAKWKIPFDDKKATKLFSKKILVRKLKIKHKTCFLVILSMAI